MVHWSLLRRSLWDAHDMVHWIVFGKYGEYFFFILCIHLSWEKGSDGEVLEPLILFLKHVFVDFRPSSV